MPLALSPPWAMQECRTCGTLKAEVFAILNSDALALVLRHLLPQTLEAALIALGNSLNGRACYSYFIPRAKKNTG